MGVTARLVRMQKMARRALKIGSPSEISKLAMAHNLLNEKCRFTCAAALSAGRRA